MLLTNFTVRQQDHNTVQYFCTLYCTLYPLSNNSDIRRQCLVDAVGALGGNNLSAAVLTSSILYAVSNSKVVELAVGQTGMRSLHSRSISQELKIQHFQLQRDNLDLQRGLGEEKKKYTGSLKCHATKIAICYCVPRGTAHAGHGSTTYCRVGKFWTCGRASLFSSERPIGSFPPNFRLGKHRASSFPCSRNEQWRFGL